MYSVLYIIIVNTMRIFPAKPAEQIIPIREGRTFVCSTDHLVMMLSIPRLVEEVWCSILTGRLKLTHSSATLILGSAVAKQIIHRITF